MEKFDKILETARKTGEEIQRKREQRTQEQQQATAAVQAAAAEMEQAAIAGNEDAYALAKEKRAAAENRLEILNIRIRNQVDKDDSQEIAVSALKEMKSDCLDEIRKTGKTFISQYKELLKTIGTIEAYSERYNQMVNYFKNGVLKTADVPVEYMVDIFPVMLFTGIKNKNQYSAEIIEKAVTNQ